MIEPVHNSTEVIIFPGFHKMTRGGGDIISDERAAQIVDGKKPTATLLSIRLVSPVISSIVVRRSYISGRIGPRSRETRSNQSFRRPTVLRCPASAPYNGPLAEPAHPFATHVSFFSSESEDNVRFRRCTLSGAFTEIHAMPNVY